MRRGGSAFWRAARAEGSGGAKMINAFGAPIDAADAKAIAEYLKKNYGS
jgi:enoyl-CoA hydratase/carnithine racemase